MLPVESMSDKLSLWIEYIKNKICIILTGSRENDYFVIWMLSNCLQEGDATGAKTEFTLRSFEMNEGFIQV